MKTFLKNTLIVLSLVFTLQGCIFVAGAAAGAAAIAVVYDHRTLSNAYQDSKISNKILSRIRANSQLRDESHVEVIVFNRVVLLIGQTPYPEWRQRAEAIANSVHHVARVYNQITIQGPTSTLTRTSDSWITAKIKGEMLTGNDNLRSSSIKVVTEEGTVYLMGIVTRKQGHTAVEIARQVSGVQRVVKIFEYTD